MCIHIYIVLESVIVNISPNKSNDCSVLQFKNTFWISNDFFVLCPTQTNGNVGVSMPFKVYVCVCVVRETTVTISLC